MLQLTRKIKPSFRSSSGKSLTIIASTKALSAANNPSNAISTTIPIRIPSKAKNPLINPPNKAIYF